MFFEASETIFANAKYLRSHMTPAEFKVWNFLKGNNIMGVRFRAQHPLGVYIADFYSYKLNLVIEIDGEIHNTESQKEYDSERTKDLIKWGIDVIRFTNYQVMNRFDIVQNEIIREVHCRLQYFHKQQKRRSPLGDLGVRPINKSVISPAVHQRHAVSEAK